MKLSKKAIGTSFVEQMENAPSRALADDFGGASGMAAQNGAGKRWSGGRSIVAKGSAGRATFIAEDIREDGREREYLDSKAKVAKVAPDAEKRLHRVADYSLADFQRC